MKTERLAWYDIKHSKNHPLFDKKHGKYKHIFRPLTKKQIEKTVGSEFKNSGFQVDISYAKMAGEIAAKADSLPSRGYMITFNENQTKSWSKYTLWHVIGNVYLLHADQHSKKQVSPALARLEKKYGKTSFEYRSHESMLSIKYSLGKLMEDGDIGNLFLGMFFVYDYAGLVDYNAPNYHLSRVFTREHDVLYVAAKKLLKTQFAKDICRRLNEALFEGKEFIPII